MSRATQDGGTSAPQALMATYERLSPAEKKEPEAEPTEIVWNDDEDHTGTVNILTAVDVRYPATGEDDLRNGDVAHQFKRILCDREPHRFTVLDENELKAHMESKAKSNGG